MNQSKVSIKLDKDYVVFSRNGYEFYDISVSRLNIDRLEEKQWFTSKVKSNLVSLVANNEN